MASAMHVEAQRLTACVEDAVDKLSLLAMLETDGSHAELIQMRSDEAGRLLDQHNALMHMYQNGIDTRKQLAGGSRIQYNANEEKIRNIASSLRQATKTLTRNLQENVDLEGNLSKIRRTCESVTEILSQTINELESGKFDTVRIKVEKEGEWRNHIMNTIAREKELSEKTSELRDNLAHERMEMSRIITMKDETIADLKDELVNQRHDVTMMISYINKDANALKECEKRIWSREVSKLKERIERCQREIEVETKAHANQENFLRQKIEENTRREEEVDRIYDKDTSELQNKLEILRTERDEVLLRLKELEESYDRDVAERALKSEAQRKQREEEAARAAGEQRSLEASILLQCNYRMHVARVAVSDIRNPKKGKKGKKKK